MLHAAYCLIFFFFFQAEDGIRDYKVTGVQTCALPIWQKNSPSPQTAEPAGVGIVLDASVISAAEGRGHTDRKSTRLNSSHLVISYAVFCLKKKNIRYRL